MTTRPDRGILSVRFLLLSFVAALLAALAFTPGLPGEFVFDDIPSIVNNDSIRMEQLDAPSLSRAVTTRQVSGNMRSLPTLTFALDYWRAGGAEPAAFKSTNLLIHALTTLALACLLHNLLLLVGVRQTVATWLAPALALAWAGHPLQVSSVLYVVQRFQTMGTLFLVLALCVYLRTRQQQMEGKPGRTGMLVTLLVWVLAMACKEDSVLLPAYTLALELTVLGFRAASPAVVTTLRRIYAMTVVAGLVVYATYLLPSHWSWEAYPARDFSTLERLLTQGRVLCLYLWQILVPMPGHMPFYYDWLQPSRGLVQPWTTLPALLLPVALLSLAWWQRARRPLFALGVFLFFTAHVIASNVIGLELAFEHRNHFALIGAVLALGSFLLPARTQGGERQPWRLAPYMLVMGLTVLGLTTLQRASDWKDNRTLARASAAAAPNSARAWFELCVTEFKEGGGNTKANTRLPKAIAACQQGTAHARYALNSLALLIVLKTLHGDGTEQDWATFHQRQSSVNMSLENRRAPMTFSFHMRNGLALEKAHVLRAFDTLQRRRGELMPHDGASVGYFLMNDLDEPDHAMPYFVRVMEQVSPYDPFGSLLASELREKGRNDLAVEIEQLALARFTAAKGQARD